MNQDIREAVERLSVAERIELVEEIWDGIMVTPDAVPITESQIKELDRRLEDYSSNPNLGITLEQLKARVQAPK